MINLLLIENAMILLIIHTVLEGVRGSGHQMSMPLPAAIAGGCLENTKKSETREDIPMTGYGRHIKLTGEAARCCWKTGR